MKPAAFDYVKPASVTEALVLLAEYADSCKILAGGQSLVPAMNFRLARPDILIDINDLRELDYIDSPADRLHIGALTRHAAFHRPVIEAPLGVLLSKVVRHIAHYPIRQRGTFAGSVAHADPASEWCLVATTLGAEMVARSVRGERVIEANAFFQGTFTTALAVDEKWRGTGVGRLLVDQAERWCRERGADRVTVTSGHHRSESHKFYKALGYEATGVRFFKRF